MEELMDRQQSVCVVVVQFKMQGHLVYCFFVEQEGKLIPAVTWPGSSP